MHVGPSVVVLFDCKSGRHVARTLTHALRAHGVDAVMDGRELDDATWEREVLPVIRVRQICLVIVSTGALEPLPTGKERLWRACQEAAVAGRKILMVLDEVSVECVEPTLGGMAGLWVNQPARYLQHAHDTCVDYIVQRFSGLKACEVGGGADVYSMHNTWGVSEVAATSSDAELAALEQRMMEPVLTAGEPSLAEQEAEDCFNYAMLLAWQVGDDRGAIEQFSQAIAHDPGYAWAYYYRARVWALMEERDKAIADCSRALELDPTLEEARLRRGLYRLKQGEAELALQDFGQALEQNPEAELAHEQCGRALLELGEPRLAIEAFSAQLEQDLGEDELWQGETYRLRGEAHERLCDWRSAETDFRLALDLDPYNEEAEAGLGRVQPKAGRNGRRHGRSRRGLRKLRAMLSVKGANG